MESQILLQRAELLLDQGRHHDAETSIRQALALQPQNSHALALLTRCFYAKQNYNHGMDAIKSALAADPHNSFYFYLLAFGLYRTNNHKGAQHHLQKAISLSPYTAEYFGLLAYVLIEEKAFKTALQKADEGLAVEGDNITCLNARSIALNKLNLTDAAIETMQDALAQDPHNEMTHATVGWNFVEKGKYRQATKHFLEALRIDPNYSSAKSGLKEALKSKVPPYRWLLQYSFWAHNKGKKAGIVLPIALYVLFRILIALTSNTSALTWALISIYVLVVVTTWSIGSIANFILLYHPIGKHALTLTEKRSAITVVASMALGITLLILYFTPLTTGTDYKETMFFAGLVSLSLALPLSTLQYPLTFKSIGWRNYYSKGLCVLGLLSLIIFVVSPSDALILFGVYGLLFLIYNWSGIFRA